AEADLAGLYSEAAGVVRVAAFTSAFHGIVVPAVADLAASHPRVAIELTEAEPLVSRAAVRQGEVDVAVCADFPDAPVPPEADLARLPLTGDRVVLVTARDTTPSERSGRVDLSSLAGEPWARSEEHTSELQSRENLVCRLLLEKEKKAKRSTVSWNS